MFYGVIDGMSGTFTNDICTGGMVNIVDSASGIMNNVPTENPLNIMKFQIATNNFQEAQNTVIAYCDFSAYGRQLSKLTQFQSYENYFRLAGRIGGVFVQDWDTNYTCITDALESEPKLGHDAGICGSTMLSLVLDSVL